MSPVRIQRKRSRGWRKPANTVIVTRGTPWGNPVIVSGDVTNELAVELYRTILTGTHPCYDIDQDFIARVKRELRGKNLACWCPLDKACHADVLLEVANQEDDDGGR